MWRWNNARREESNQIILRAYGFGVALGVLQKVNQPVDDAPCLYG
jgi:hypothetical protein